MVQYVHVKTALMGASGISTEKECCCKESNFLSLKNKLFSLREKKKKERRSELKISTRITFKEYMNRERALCIEN